MPGVLALICRDVTGIVFVYSALAKLWRPAAYRQFRAWVAALPVPFSRNRLTAPLMAAAELTIGVMVAVSAATLAGLIAAAVMLTGFALATFLAVRSGTHIPCNCFGRAGKRLGIRHVVRDGILAAVALAAASGIAGGPPAVHSQAVGFSFGIAAVAAALIVFWADISDLFGALAPGGAGLTWPGGIERD